MNKIFFYIKKLYNDIFNPLIYDYVKFNKELKKYYFLKYNIDDMLAHRSQRFHFDNKGIPVIPHYVDSSSGNSMHYFPIAIGQMALAYLHQYWDEQDESAKDRFINISDWFVENQTEEGFWLAYTNVDKFHVKSPWKSAMAQSRAISVLLRAYDLTGKEKYLNSAKRAFDTMIDSESDISCMLPEGRFYLEYPSIKPPKVLNGFMFSIFGIIDFAYFTNDKQAYKVLDECLDSLSNILEKYDTGKWTTYDLNHIEYEERIRPCTVHYQFIHVNQLKALYYMTGRKELMDTAVEWENYYKNKSNLISVYYNKFRGIFKL
ncbi:D-glucuronyl C5-epimerase family protein [Vibrio sp. Vb2880]|uniref:D-glucuronyl C5-epimerase family protein n=1 Tax=Vibrio TaxID=662 RepID=UPI0029655F14|nr:D-glucuronyl C5-epimerase family protein [Vibrio sp. Vb2880]MDW1575885.1 D-glucuronyl C5-epimerase family protein [Vibrio sp. Vb2880]